MFLLSSQKINKTTSLLLFLTLFLLPFQLGKHFWPTFSYVLGQRVDYLSPTLYVSDIPIIGLFVLHGKRFFLIIGWWFYFLLLILSLGIFFSQSPFNGWYGLIKVVEFVFFGWVMANYAQKLFPFLYWILGFDLLLEGVLGVLEFIHQGSINGLWYFLGERTFSASTPGIANATIHGQLVLRPYATFPHPNVFAGFVLISLIFFLTTLLYFSGRMYKCMSGLLLFLGTGILLLTLSRVALAVWVFVIILGVLIRFGKHIGFIVGSMLGLFFAVLLALPFFSGRFLDAASYTESLDLRLLLQQAAFHMFVSHPFLGVGLNDFLIALPSFLQGHVLFGFLQPAHNIFLLVLAETGISGFVIFCVLFGVAFTKNLRIVRKKPSQFTLFAFLSLFVVLLIGLTDHYFLTIQQGQLFFACILGLSFSHGTIRLWPFTKNLRLTPFTK